MRGEEERRPKEEERIQWRQEQSLSLLGLLYQNPTDWMACTDVDFSVLSAKKSKIKVVADLVPGEDHPPGLQRVPFSLCLHMVENRALVSLLIRTPILSWGPHPHDLIST